MTRQRTKVFQLRLTPDEAALLKEKSEPYGSVSHYIRCAVAEYSNIHVRQRLELIQELGMFYRKFRNELSWAGGNLNQSVKRANELSVAGLLPPAKEHPQKVPGREHEQGRAAKGTESQVRHRPRIFRQEGQALWLHAG